MSNKYVDVQDNGETTTKTTYSCTKKSMQYTIIGEDIKKDFDFLLPTGGICTNLDLMLAELQKAANVTDAFYFENGAVTQDVQHVYEEIKADVSRLKEQLAILHRAFMTDIDNVNAELDFNFGHFVGVKVKAIREETSKNQP